VRYFETMEHATLGGWPAEIEDPERGYADPNVPIIMPRRLALDLYCPNGHVARRFDNEAVLQAVHAQGGVLCPTCKLQTTLANTQKVERLILRHPLFRNVGLRIYDSISAMNDAGLIIELPTMSAEGKLSRGKEGGSALGSADAFRQGLTVYGTGSEAQVGFMQNRTYGWLMNLRTLPDVKVPTICIFGIEESKKDDESGGLQILGPRIAGKARTSAVPGWVGNLLYASHEPEDVPKGTANSPHMVFRLWLTTHTDPRDARKMPILAKHRGTPLGIDYLEDPWYDNPEDRKSHAWEKCSLKVFFRMLAAQVAEQTAALKAKFPKAPGFVEQTPESTEDDVIGTVGTPAQAAAAASVPSGVAVTAGAAPVVTAPVADGMPRVISRRGRASTPAPPVQATAPAVSSPLPTATPVLGTPSAGAKPADAAIPAATSGAPPVIAVGKAQPEPPSVLEQQLTASIAKIEADKTAASTAGVTAAQGAGPAIAPQPAQPAASPAPAQSTGAPRVVRRPRPPVH
jgi:hypothetical protein